MAVNKGVWGIDIGQCALKALRLEMIDDKPTATAFDYVEHTKILSQPDADPDALIREALEKFLSRNDVKNDDVAVGIAGQSGLARFVKLPPVEEKKIAEIVKFEAKQQIPFPLDEVVWDFQKIAGGEAVDGFALETEIGLFAMKRDVISRYLGYFTSSKIEVHFVQMSPLALVNFATYELLKKDEAKKEEVEDPAPRGKKRCTVVMDVGTDASNLIITDGGKIIWQRPIPLGGNNFTRALTKELKLTFAKAEHLKRNAAKSPDMASILKAIKPVLTDFVGEVQRSLGYFTNTHRDAHVAYMVGLGSAFKLPGLQKYLADKLALEVKKPTKFEKLSGDSVLNDPLFQENLLTFPVAYGLALQGLGQARLTTNLLPQEIRMDRLIRAKKPMAVAAAALMLVGVVGLAAGFSKPYAALNDENLTKAMASTKDTASAFSAQEGRYKTKEEESKKKEEETKTIIAGQEERLNWPRFVEVFTASLPHPGEKGNLNETQGQTNSSLQPFSQVQLWKGEGMAGQAALDWFNKRMRVGVPIEEAIADERSDHPKALAMVNVETVHTRYVKNLNGFLQAAHTRVNDLYDSRIADWMRDEDREEDPVTDPAKPEKRWKPKNQEVNEGWVIEIRGYTDYDTKAVPGKTFVRQALLRNLQRIDVFATATDEGKIGRFIHSGVQDPVKGKVTCAFVYNVWITNPQPNTFSYIDKTYLDALVGGGGTSPVAGGGFEPGDPDERGGMPPTPMPGPTGDTQGTTTPTDLAPAWQGLGSTGRTVGGTAPGNQMTPGSIVPPGGVVQPGGMQPTKPKAGNDERRRYEFVVMLIWREPGLPAGTPDPNAGTPAATTEPGRDN
ncbi:MAG: type IV pilus assembly protein PilM [Planctomycetia bacterium]|nr:type IV pilus assembly protein PilM [Planctomycetia bacterium]